MKFSSARARFACSFVAGFLAMPMSGFAAAPLGLRDAIDAALENNPELQAFSFSLQAQDVRVQQAALRPAPEVSLNIENALGSGDYRGSRSAEYTLALSQVLELGGKRDARISSARAGRNTLDVERQARQLDVVAEVTRRFIAVATQQEQLKLAGRALDLAQKTVDGTERRVNAAKSPHAELDRARIALDRAKLAERSAAIELDVARKQLAATWGQTQPLINGEIFGEVKADLFQLPPAGDYADLLKRLKANPDFLRFASETRLRDAELRLATTLRRPDLTLGAGVRRLQASSDQALVASIAMPLFSSQRADSQIAEARAELDRVDADRRGAEIKAQATLYELQKQLTRAVAEASTLQSDILPRSEEAMRETEYAYTRGRFGYLELVDAQREYVALQTALIEAASNAHGLRVEIERLTNAPLDNSTQDRNAE